MKIPKEFEKQIKPCPVDFTAAQNLIGRASKDLKTAHKIKRDDPEAAYTLLYDSMLHAGMACMAVYGFRADRHGKHKTVILFMAWVLGKKHEGPIDFYDRMRRKRHQFLYEPGTGDCTQKEIASAEKMAKQFLKLVILTIREKHPQKEFDF